MKLYNKKIIMKINIIQLNNIYILEKALLKVFVLDP